MVGHSMDIRSEETMSVISLSSENEDECIILDSDHEDSGGRSLQTHQVFIVDRNLSCSLDEEKVLQNVTNNSSSVVNSCQTLPITNVCTENKSESSLKLLAEKLAKVLGNTYSDVTVEQYDKANPETKMSSLEKTILGVSRGSFTKNKQKNNILRSQTDKKTKNSLLIKKIRKTHKKINSDVVVSQTKMQSSTIQSVQIVSEAKTEVNQNSSQDTRCVERKNNIQQNQRKRSLEPVENSIPKPKKKLTKRTKLPSPKNIGPYDNKLKFTFDRSVSTYSVSVVSPSEPEPSVENINICLNNPHENNIGNSVKHNGSSCQKTIQLTADLDLTESDPIDQPEVIGSGDFGSFPSSILFANILNIESSFVKHYNIVFDDKTDELCVEMGHLLLQTIENEKKLVKIMEKTQPPHDFLVVNDNFQTAAQTCQDALHYSKRKFIDDFSQIHDQINIGHVIGTQLKIVLLTAWFLKMFLSITIKFPDFIDVLNEVRSETLKLLSEETVKWPLISKTFIKDEQQFGHDCVFVLQLIKDCLKDQNELNSQSTLGLDQIVNPVKPQAVTCATSNNQAPAIPKELQWLEKSQDLKVSVVKNSTETKTTNCNGICSADSNLAKHLKVHKTKLENHHELISAIGYGSKKTEPNLTNPVLSVRPDLYYQHKVSPFGRAQSKKQNCPNYTFNLNADIQPNIQYQPYLPNLHNHDTSSPSKHSQTQYHCNNQAHYQESSTNRFKTTTPITSNSFQGSFYPRNLDDSNSNMQQFPVTNDGGIEMSSCPITINNYNITNYPPLPPELMSNYHDSSFQKMGTEL